MSTEPATPEQAAKKADVIHGQLFCAIFAALLNREGITWEAAFSTACEQADAAAHSYRTYFGGTTIEATTVTPQPSEEQAAALKRHFDSLAKDNPDAVNAILATLAEVGVVI